MLKSRVLLLGTLLLHVVSCGADDEWTASAASTTTNTLNVGQDAHTYIVLLDQEAVRPATNRVFHQRTRNREEKEAKMRGPREDAAREVKALAALHGISPTRIYSTALSGFVAELTDEQAAELAESPGVDVIVNDETFTPQVAAIDVIDCSDLGSYYVDRAVSFAGGPVDHQGDPEFIWILDSGIDQGHPDLNIKGAPYAVVISSGSTDDVYGHGTMVAGVAAAKYNTTGSSGVAAGAWVVPVQVSKPGLLTDDFTTSVADVLAGLDHVANFNIEGDVVNMSLYSFEPESCSNQSNGTARALKDAMQALTFEGTWVITGSGNSSISSDLCHLAEKGVPACINGFQILTTSSIGLSSGDVPNCGPHGWGAPVDYATVGDQSTLYKNGDCANTSGTSMAAAVLSGIIVGRSLNAQIPSMGSISCCGETQPIANASTLSTLKFDVELELDELSFYNVRDLDGGEDLFGNFDFRRYETDSRVINSTSRTMWTRSEATAAGSVGFSAGVHSVGTKHTIATNISYFDLLTSKFKVGGSVKDDEGVFGSRVFKCTNCNADTNTARTFDLSSLPKATASIQALALTSPATSQLLTLSATVDYVSMAFAENGNTNDGWVSTRWRLRVKPHN